MTTPSVGGSTPTPAETTDQLIDRWAHRGDTYKAAMNELLQLIEQSAPGNAEYARQIVDRALDKAWEKRDV